jgi:uncharacterized membrane protein
MQTSRSSAQTTALIGAVVAVVGLIFAFESAWYSDWYAVFRLVHVVAAVIWIGGGVLLVILGLRAEMSDDPNEIVHVARWAGWVGQRVFAPASGIVLLMGIALMLNTDWGWGKFWVVVGLLGFAATFVTGIAVLSPQAKRVAELSASKGPTAPETVDAVRRILMIARIDMAVLLIVVADMVTKPFS